MKETFEVREGRLVASDSPAAAVAVYAAPDEAERRELLDTLRIDPHTLESALDPEEVSRVEFSPDHVFVIWKRPNRVSIEERVKFDVSSVGIFLGSDRLTIVYPQGSVPFPARELGNVGSPADVMQQFLLFTIRHYLGHLKAVKRLTSHLQGQLEKSMGNVYLLQMFALGESLIYYLDALETNGIVLTRLRTAAGKLGLSEAQVAMLDDIMIEHQQCYKQTQIHSSVLSGLMDARGTIINNNMNTLLKNLTLINVVFLPLNLIASVGGMSEYTMMTAGVGWRVAYFALAVGMLALGWVTWILVRRIDRSRS